MECQRCNAEISSESELTPITVPIVQKSRDDVRVIDLVKRYVCEDCAKSFRAWWYAPSFERSAGGPTR